MPVTNPFRDRTMRAQFDAAVTAYCVQHRDLFHEGRQFIGSSFASYFWAGFRQTPQVGRFNFKDATARKTISYAYFRAGQLIHKEELRGKK